jgi:hypothetical protein
MKTNPWSDSDKDGVINIHDCAPHNPKKQEVLNWKNAKSKVVSKKYLFHKTNLESARKILKTGELRPSSGTGKAHLSENYNPHVVFKKYKNPVVLVLEKKKIPYLKKIDYNKTHIYQDLKFKTEKEWITPGIKIKKALKGIILNEGRKFIKLPLNKPGLSRVVTFSYPTKYVTGVDIYNI